jgi:uncharacterized membrane protein HdeD (DUF308 family)
MAIPSSVSVRRSRGRVNSELSALLAHNWWAVGLRGLCAILFGLIALFTPAIALLSLVLVFGVYMLIDGGFALISAARAAQHHRRWATLLFSGLVSLAAAGFTLLLPGLTALAFVVIIAAWSIVSGILMIVASISLKRDHGRLWLALGGVASVVFGILLAIAPLIGALVLTWWIGAYAMVFGVTLLVLAVRLRPHRTDPPAPAVAAHA